MAANGYLNIENYINSIDGPVMDYVKYPTNVQLSSLGTDNVSIKWQNNASESTALILEYSADNKTFTPVVLNTDVTTYN